MPSVGFQRDHPITRSSRPLRQTPRRRPLPQRCPAQPRQQTPRPPLVGSGLQQTYGTNTPSGPSPSSTINPSPLDNPLAWDVYRRTWQGFAYVAFVTDVHSHRIVGRNVAATLKADILPLQALDMAAWDPGGNLAGLTHHRDSGVRVPDSFGLRARDDPVKGCAEVVRRHHAYQGMCSSSACVRCQSTRCRGTRPSADLPEAPVARTCAC